MSLIQIFNLAAYVVKGFLARPHDAIFSIHLQRASHLLFEGLLQLRENFIKGTSSSR